MAVVAGTSAFQVPSIDSLWSPKGQVTIQVQGKDRETIIGEVEDFGPTPELTEVEYRSRSFPRSKLLKTTVMADALTINMVVKTLSKQTFAALFMGDPDSVLIQPAVTDGTAIFSDPAPGDIFSVGSRDISVTAVTDGEVSDPVSYVLGTHYSVDRRTGRVQILAIPAGAAESLEITFTAPAITAADKRQSFGMLQTQGLRCKLFFRELGSEAPFNFEATYWEVELRPSGAIPHIIGDEYANIELTGKVYAQSGKPAGMEYGQVVEIPKTQLV